MSTKQMQVSLMELFKVGSQRGNKKSKLNPRLKKYIYGASNGLSLIDLTEMQNSLDRVEEFFEKLGRKRKQVLVVGTAKHLQELTKNFADKIGTKGMPFVNQRWLGGTLTNWSTIKRTLKTLEKNEKIIENEKFFKELSRNEQLSISRETEKLQNIFGGLRYLKSNKPGALVVLDASENAVAIKEAQLIGIPVIALSSTSAKVLPENLKYTVVCNNNSTKLLDMLTDRFAGAYNKGLASLVDIEEKSEEKTESKK